MPGLSPGVLVEWPCDTFSLPPAHLGWPSPLQPLPQRLSDPGHRLQPTRVHARGFQSYNLKPDLEQLKKGSLGCVCRKGQLLLTEVRMVSVSELESTTGPRRLPIAFTPQSLWQDGFTERSHRIRESLENAPSFPQEWSGNVHTCSLPLAFPQRQQQAHISFKVKGGRPGDPFLMLQCRILPVCFFWTRSCSGADCSRQNKILQELSGNSVKERCYFKTID